MLCYYFPPLGGGGVQRSVKFAKYLPSVGWSPVVVAVEPNCRNLIEQGHDESLLGELPPEVEVERCRSLEMSYLYCGLTRIGARKALFELERVIPFLHMDYKLGWAPAALRVARRVVTKFSPAVVYTSSPPYSSHLVGLRLKRSLGLPWVADFRDPWTRSVEYRPPSPLHAWLETRLENRVLAEADAIIANTDVNREEIIRAFGVPEHRVTVIPNGYDPGDFNGLKVTPRAAEFVVCCVGKFYELSEPERFFRAFRHFSDDHPEARLLLRGWLSRRVRQAAERVLRDGTWEAGDRIPHDAAVRLMRESSVLLANVPDGASHWVPGKLYEYLAARRPVLFVGPPEGAAASIVRATGAGRVTTHDEAAILAALGDLHRSWSEKGAGWSLDEAAVRRFDRRHQATQLAKILRGVAGVAT
jgi:glycosyltransferase involved in cell wall biosynthesis